jgi:hypothetical protein
MQGMANDFAGSGSKPCRVQSFASHLESILIAEVADRFPNLKKFSGEEPHNEN